MDNHPESFSPEESLRVIQTMIEKTKTTVADKSFYFLLWGWLVFIGAVGQYILAMIVRTDMNPIVWCIMIVGVIASPIYGIRQKKTRTVKTYVDEGLRNIWTAIGVVQTLIVFIFMRRGDWEHCYTIFILTYSIGCFLTGRLLRFAPLIRGAVFCWVLAVLTTFVDVGANMLLLAAAVLGSYIIPGYLLRAEYKHQLSKETR
jgi:Flp pilus assembly protein TadB